jgi:hypothetical protein
MPFHKTKQPGYVPLNDRKLVITTTIDNGQLGAAILDALAKCTCEGAPE